MSKEIIIPEYENTNDSYPGNIKPGAYTINEFVELLRQNSFDHLAIEFLADMLEE